MGTIFSRVKLSGKHVAALLALMLLSAVTAMLLPTALASMIDIGVAGENRNTILIIAAVMATLAILRLCVYYILAIHSKVGHLYSAGENNLDKSRLRRPCFCSMPGSITSPTQPFSWMTV